MAEYHYAQQPQPKKHKKRTLLWVTISIVALLIALGITGIYAWHYFTKGITVIGSSMMPTYEDGDSLTIERYTTMYSSLKRGDIVACRPDSRANDTTYIIKRIVGLPGEHVQIKDNAVYINDELLVENYLDPDTVTELRSLEYSDITLGDDEFYVLGDNRGVSLDSRSYGPVSKEDITGKVWSGGSGSAGSNW